MVSNACFVGQKKKKHGRDSFLGVVLTRIKYYLDKNKGAPDLQLPRNP